MNKIAKQFEPCYFGNGWGNYADIENYEYNLVNLQRLQLHKSENNVSKTNKQDRAVASLIIKVSSTTFVTLLLSYFVYRAI